MLMCPVCKVEKETYIVEQHIIGGHVVRYRCTECHTQLCRFFIDHEYYFDYKQEQEQEQAQEQEQEQEQKCNNKYTNDKQSKDDSPV